MTTPDQPQGGSDAPALAPPCDHPAALHPAGKRPPAAVVCVETGGAMRRMLLCGECASNYAHQAADLALAGYAIGIREPVAVILMPLPQLPLPGGGA